MYDEHYGLSGRPFQLTPDPRFWFDSATHRKAMAYLGYGLSQGEGFIVVTGEIGAGKTTLVGHLVETLDVARLNVVRIVSTQVAAEDLLRTVADGVGAASEAMSKAALLSGIERQLHAIARTGKRTLLIVDEVQALPTESLEELRMLSNFQGAGHALLQIMLLGQPEFRERLGDPALEQLSQRVIAIHHLEPMLEEEVDAYLAHRLAVVGWTGRPDFDVGAVAAMFGWSGGIPRKLNQLASRLMLHGAIEELDVFTAADVATVIADLAGDLPAPRRIAADAPAPEVARPLPPPDSPRMPAAPARDPSALPFLADQPVVPVVPVEPQYAVDRLAMVEQRLDEQDAALRRVLTLLVDWVEAGERSEAARRDAA